jgi:hypothetical protein
MPIPEYLQLILYSLNIHNYIPEYLEKLANLNERIYLSENLKNCLMEIDKKHLPEIIRWKEYIKKITSKDELKIYMKDNLQPLLDLYQFEQKQIYDRSFYGMIKKFFNYLIIIISIIIIINLIFNLNNNKDEILLLKKEIMELNKKLLLLSNSNRKDDYIIFKTK